MKPEKPTRAQILDLIAFAGYHQDRAAFTRLLIENRVSYAAAKSAYGAGARQRAAGIKCGCIECKQREAERDTLLPSEVP